jgi:hypothetical protein
VIVYFDGTGSMGDVPKTVQTKLAQLMNLLLRKSYLTDPQIMIGCIQDAKTDQVPFQTGQFESGIEIENDLTNLCWQGNGGGNGGESYELGLYFAARKTKIDCWDKRQKKGYMFIIGDEMCHKPVPAEIERIFGDKIEGGLTVESLIAEVQERYELFYIMPNLTNHYHDATVNKFWKKLLGERFLKLDDPAGVAELIATTIGVCEGQVDLEDIGSDLADAGASKQVANAVGTALATVGSGTAVTKKAKGTDITVDDSGKSSGIATM